MKAMAPMQPMHFDTRDRWWPGDLGEPNSSGSQNDVHYAYFAKAQRLVLRTGTDVVTYDTGTHAITGVSQASDAQHATFTTDRGAVDVTQLKRL